MRLLDRLVQPFKGYRLLRTAIRELQGIRVALERQTVLLEMGLRGSSHGAQSFRSLGSGLVGHQAGDQGQGANQGQDGSSVSYVDPQMQSRMLEVEEGLRGILGRDPTEGELTRAFQEAGL